MDESEKLRQRRERLERYVEAISLRPGHPLFEAMRSGKLKQAPSTDRKIREVELRGANLANAYLKNGPDFPVDSYLRKFLAEYNNRLFMGEGIHQPTSFNVMRAFIEPDEVALVLRLLPEHYYLVDLPVALEAITNPDHKFSLKNFRALKELEVFQANFIGSPINFKTNNHPDLQIYGVSCVREGNEVSFFGLYGKPNSQPQKELVPFDKASLGPGKEFLAEGKEEIDLSDIGLMNDPNMAPVAILARADIENDVMQVRYVLHEKVDVYDVACDDPDVLIPLLEHDQYKEIRDFHVAEISRYGEVIDATISLCDFLTAVDRLEDDIEIERHPTLLKLDASTRFQKVKKGLSKEEAPNYVAVSVVRKIEEDNKFNIDGISLSVERSGYWKTLRADQIGRDKQGKEVHGKTWVTSEKRWEEFSVAVPDTAKAPIPIDLSAELGSGWIYVMRNAAHPKDTYKVGYTSKSSDERADQLGATSGQIDIFNVVQEWEVKAPRAIESEIHRRLATYRLRKTREFFCARYPLIREVIEATIQDFDAAMTQDGAT